MKGKENTSIRSRLSMAKPAIGRKLVTRKLIRKKFVNGKMLVIVFVACTAYMFFQLASISNYPAYIVALFGVPIFFVVWHKVYQVLYDIKLLFHFNSEYDSDIELPKCKRLPTITFIIPSYQEPFMVARMTFDSVVNTPYSGRKEIIVVDNSQNTSSEDFFSWEAYVKSFNANSTGNIISKFIYNPKKGKLKPGNLDLAQDHIQEGELVVFLDVDSTLPDMENLLERSVAEFEADQKLAFLQFRIRATNNHFNSLTQAIAISQDLLRLRMISRGYGGYKIFEGHNGIWRKSVLDELGAWTDYYRGDIIITEDILKSAHAYANGYYGKPLNIETGEWVPTSLKAFESMWMRWMYGNSQVFFKYFREIYAKTTTLVEKFDISYHILHQLVTMCFFFIVFFFQLFIPGSATNVFILSIGIFPQIVGAVTACCKSSYNLSTGEKIKYAYAGFFFIDTFIMYTQIKSDIKFVLRVPQGWKVTEKGVEGLITWRGLIRSTFFHILIAILCIGVCMVSWNIHYDMKWNSLFHHFGLLFISSNLLLCIAFFGKQRRAPNSKKDPAVINDEACRYTLKADHVKSEAV